MIGIVAGALAALLAMSAMWTADRGPRARFDLAPGWLGPGVVRHRAREVWWAPVIRWSLNAWLWSTLLMLILIAPGPPA